MPTGLYDDQRVEPDAVPDDETLRSITGISKSEEAGMDERAREPSSADAAERGQLGLGYTGRDGGGKDGGSKDSSTGDFAKGAASSSATGAAVGVSKWKLAKELFWGSPKRKTASSVGVGTIITIIGLAIMSIFLAGPLQLIHISKFLDSVHFASQTQTEDVRLGKLYRYVRSGGDSGKTRLGYLGSHFHDQMVADLKSKGIKPKYGVSSSFTGFEIDRTNPDSPYHGMSDEEVKASLKENGVKNGVHIEDGKITVTADGLLGSREANGAMVKSLGYDGISGWLRARIFDKYGWVSWHPLTPVDKKLNTKIAKTYEDWKKKKVEQYKQGTQAAKVDASTGGQETEDSDGKTSTSPYGAEEQAAASETVTDQTKTADILKGLGSKSLGVAGGVAAAQGIVCSMRQLGTEIGKIRYVMVVLPLIRMSMDTMASAAQIESGKDINDTTVDFATKSTDEVDKNGKTVSTWDMASSIQAEMGKPDTQRAVNAALLGIAAGIPGWLAWAQNKDFAPVCSDVGVAAGGIISVGLGIVSSGFLTTVSGLLVGAAISPTLMNLAAGYLAGQAIDVAASGANWGDDVNYGSRLAANSMGMQTGGVAMSQQQETALVTEQRSIDAKDFANKSLAYRLFNTHDPRTLAGKAVDNSQQIQPSNVATTINNLFGNFGALFKLPATFTSKAGASATPYDYGFSKYGFSVEDQENPAVQDPYANGEIVAGLLDSDQGQSYVDRAKACFGVDIRKGDQGWEVAPVQDAGDQSEFLNPYDQDPSSVYNQANCNDKSLEWLRVRFFILDMGTFEGYACFMGDATSCEHDGAVASPDTASSAGTPIKIASMNVHGYVHDKADYQRRQHTLDDYIKSNDIDIVGFQELEIAPKSLSQKQIMLNDLGSDYAAYPEDSNNAGHRSENSIIWKKQRFTKVAAGVNTTDYVYFYGGQLHVPWVKLQDTSTGQIFIVQNTHDPANAHRGDSTARRAANANAHVVDAKHWIADGLPVIMTGDFNSGYNIRPGKDTITDRNQLPYCLLTADGYMRDSYDVLKKRQGKCPTKDLSGNYIDHVFLSKEFTVSSNIWDRGPKSQGATDHPVLVVDALIPGASLVGSTNMMDDYANECTRLQASHPGLACDGQCVDFVKFRLDKLTGKNFASLGNGGQVTATLKSMGYEVDHEPAVNRVVSWPPGGFPGNTADSEYGHVAWVSQVNGDGTIVVEEYNYLVDLHYDKRTIPANIVPLLSYAHTEVDIK